MKVFEFTTHVTIDDDSRFCHNKTGFGYMVYDIAKSVGSIENVDLFCANIMAPDVYRDHIHILKWNWFLFIRFFSFCNVCKAISFLYHYRVSFFTSIRVLYAFLLAGYIKHIIKQYDVVHIHGCSFYTQAIIDVCKKEEIPFLITLHGLNSFAESIEKEESMGRFEKDFLSSAYKNHINISFISSGDIKKVCSYLKLNETPSCFTLISNGCDISVKKQNFSVRSKYRIDDNVFVFLNVGNFSDNKNQIAVAKAYNLLPEAVQQKIVVLFCGGYYETSAVATYIQKNGLSDRLISCGVISKGDIHNYYSAANATILTSFSEGFGLSIIEGFVYGKPNLTYNDLSAVPDIFDSCAMMIIERKGEADLAEAMKSMMGQEWDSSQIQKYSLRFSLEEMAEKYISLYSRVIDTNT